MTMMVQGIYGMVRSIRKGGSGFRLGHLLRVLAWLMCSVHVFGLDVEKLRQRAEAGNAAAQLDLGWLHENGDGVPQDDSEAVKWYRKAAEQGLPTAQSNLGMMLMEGRGGPADRAAGLEWFRKAAHQGHSMASFNLGLAYFNGDGVPKDFAVAIRWFRKAADNGEPNTQSEAAGIYQSIESVPWALSNRGISAEKGLPAAQNRLGLMYDLGLGVEQDFSEAFKWYRKAAEQGLPMAQRNLANLYYSGRGVTRNNAEGIKWFRRAAEQGDTQSQNQLGTLYALGKGVPKDIVQACLWFTVSAASGDEYGLKGRETIIQLMSAEQIAESERLASALLDVGAEAAEPGFSVQ